MSVQLTAREWEIQRDLVQKNAKLVLNLAIRHHQAVEAKLRGQCYGVTSPAWRILIVDRLESSLEHGQVLYTIEAYPCLSLFAHATELGDLVWPEELPSEQPSWVVAHLFRRGFEPIYTRQGYEEFEVWRRVTLPT